MKKAFSLIEAMLTMLIVGVIAAVTFTVIRPDRYKAQAMLALRQKAYASIDEATRAVMLQCTKNMNLGKIFNNCDKTASTHTFGTGENAIYALYMRGTTGAANTNNGTCYKISDKTSLRLKNGMCLYFGAYSIFVDVNGNTGPNTANMDTFTITLDARGVSSDVPQ